MVTAQQSNKLALTLEIEKIRKRELSRQFREQTPPARKKLEYENWMSPPTGMLSSPPQQHFSQLSENEADDADESEEFTENEIEEFRKEENGMAPMSEVQVQDKENNRWVTRFHTRYGQVMHPKTWASLQEIYGSAFLRAYSNVIWPTELMGNRALAVDRAQRQVYKRSPRRPFTPRKVAGAKEVYFEHIDNLNIDEKRKKKMKKKWSTVFSSAMSVAHTKLYEQGEAMRRRDNRVARGLPATSSSSSSSSISSSSESSSSSSGSDTDSGSEE
ncbi:hypothetical protein QAD02_003874 [Eretmocerus hayati]|uniref:Uncharacterized protein n=1 Tax=Eretmocerus hayati TaxID=131215 RepID=A0ACC2NST4_9HYME|nr:hypothetical protein QAD02_003874 [Eretmocerus hayati]